MAQDISIDRAAVARAVLAVLDDVLTASGKDLPPNFGEATGLVGQEAMLDSLGLVTLVVDLEQWIESEYGIVIALANDRAMSMRNSPFRTVGTLTDYICSLLADEG